MCRSDVSIPTLVPSSAALPFILAVQSLQRDGNDDDDDDDDDEEGEKESGEVLDDVVDALCGKFFTRLSKSDIQTNGKAS